MSTVSRIFVIFGIAAIAALPATSRALLEPSPIATDARIKTVMYSPNEVIKYTGYYRYESNIQFENGEQIGTISLGDSVAWQINPLGNRLFLKPIEQDATTNMTVITNKHTYFFELHAAEAKDVSDKNLSFELRIIYPNEESETTTVSTLDQVPDLEHGSLNKYNFRYTISGSQDIAPIRIFDDGEFTYFQFHDVNAEVPAFFQVVDKEGDEAIINYRTRGPYIVVERVAARFTLRHGKSVTCVFNEAMSEGRAPKPGSDPWYKRWFSSSTSATVSNASPSR